LVVIDLRRDREAEVHSNFFAKLMRFFGTGARGLSLK